MTKWNPTPFDNRLVRVSWFDGPTEEHTVGEIRHKWDKKGEAEWWIVSVLFQLEQHGEIYTRFAHYELI